MLYKNKIKVQNILKSAVAFVFMLTLSLSAVLSPLAKAEEAKYTWKTLTSVPVYGQSDLRGVYVNSDGSKLFIREESIGNNDRASLWMSADDGATWREIWSKQISFTQMSFNADASKIVVSPYNKQYFYISTDGGQSWVYRGIGSERIPVHISPDGSFLVSCSNDGTVSYTTYISTDDGQTWTQKGTNNVSCPEYVSNNGTLIARSNSNLAKSTDYGQTWTEFPNAVNMYGRTSFSNNGNNIFDGEKISLDGGNHWTPSNAPIPAGQTVYQTGISDDGKKLFVNTNRTGGTGKEELLTSVDGGRTWHSENIIVRKTAMSNDGSKLFNAHIENYGLTYRVGTLTTPQPVTPGAGAGGTVAPSTGSTSATPGQKPGKASGRLAETGTSTWMVGGLAVVAVAAGALVLRKRL